MQHLAVLGRLQLGQRVLADRGRDRLLALGLVRGIRIAEPHVVEADRGIRRRPVRPARAPHRPRTRSGSSMISWMRPSAPSAWFTELIAPNAWPSGMIIMNRNRMNATRFAIVIAPLATRNPPTPSTTRNETCIAIPAIGTTSDEIFATRMPACHAPSASAFDGRDLAVGRVRGADGADRADRALDRRREIADLLLLIAAGDPHAAGEQHHADHRDRDRRARSVRAAPGR